MNQFLSYPSSVDGILSLNCDFLRISNIESYDNNIYNVNNLYVSNIISTNQLFQNLYVSNLFVNTSCNISPNVFIRSTGTGSGLYIAGLDDISADIIHLYSSGGEAYLDMSMSAVDKHLNFRRWNGTAWTGCGHLEYSSTPHINFPSGGYYSLNGTSVLNQTTLGSTVVNSSLQNLGILQGQPLQNADGYLQTGYLSSEIYNRTYTKIETNRSGVYLRNARQGTGISSTMVLQHNYYRDISGIVRDNSSYGSSFLAFVEAPQSILQLGYIDATNNAVAYLQCEQGLNLSTFSTDITTSGNINISTGKTYKINNTDMLSSTTLGASVVNSSLTSLGTLTNLTSTGLGTFNSGLLTRGVADNNNCKSYIKMRTQNINVFFRITHFSSSSTSSTRFTLNYNADASLSVPAKDDGTLGACEMLFEEDGQLIFRNCNSSTTTSTARAGILANGRFYITNTTDATNYYPTVSSTYLQRVLTGKYTGGLATGTVNFGITFLSAPNVHAQLEINSTNIYVINIHTVTTTGFSFIKRFYNGTTIADASAENFWWTAIGSI